MTERRPLAWINGRPQAIPDTDSLPPALVPTPSGSTVDGGNFSTNHTGNLKIDLGSFT